MMKRTGLYIGMLIGLAAGLLIGPAPARSADVQRRNTRAAFFEPIAWLLGELEQQSDEPLETPEDRDEFRRQMLVGAYHGMLSKCDHYSVYWPPDMLKEFKDELAGKFGGLGISIRFDRVRKAVVVERPIPGQPAVKAGIGEGDMIVKVLEVATGVVTSTEEFRSVHDAVRILRGEPGTDVTVTVVPADGGPEQEITITRAIIEIPGVRAVELIDPAGKIGYVYVPYFSNPMVADLMVAIDDLRKQGAEGLILDLRQNPGGLLKAAKQCADLFLTGQPIVRVKQRGQRPSTHRSHRRAAYEDVPLVLLIDRASASGSEILAAALRDNGRAILVGEPTYGKASVQQLFDNPHGQGAFKLTVARYYTPNDELIEGKGVLPDVEIKLSEGERRRLAIYLGRKNSYPPPKPGEDLTADPTEEGDGDGEDPDGEEAVPFEDTQLTRAVEVMNGLLAQREALEEPHEAVAEPAPGG